MAKAFSEAKKQEPNTWTTPSSPNTMAQIRNGTKTPLTGVKGGGNSYSTPTRIQHRPQHFMRGMAAEQPESARVPHFCAFWGSLWPRTVICRWPFADRKRVRRTFVISNRHRTLRTPSHPFINLKQDPARIIGVVTLIQAGWAKCQTPVSNANSAYPNTTLS